MKVNMTPEPKSWDWLQHRGQPLHVHKEEQPKAELPEHLPPPQKETEEEEETNRGACFIEL